MELSRASLREAMDEFFRAAEQTCADRDDLRELGRLVREQREAVSRPMRVAFVGKTNAGKSTMLNAFLGERIASTGNGEWTFNVSWICHGETRGIRVHLVDGTVVERPYEALDALTERASADGLLNRIRYLEFLHPNPILKHFDLIDTPGLHSFYEDDSRNTKALLTNPDTRPHAVVFLFSETLRKDDLDELELFHSSAGSLMSALTAIGALTKVDLYADAEHDGIEQGWRVIRQIEESHPVARHRFYSILPVISQAAYGAAVLDASDLRALESIATLSAERSRKLLMVENFLDRDYPGDPDVPPKESRRILWDKLGESGIQMAVAGLQSGIANRDIGAYIYEESRIGQLRELVASHFGNRAYLIKSRSALDRLRAEAFRICHESERQAGANRILAAIDRILLNEPRFQEFQLLERHFSDGAGLLPHEVSDLLEATGERGTECASRLGCRDSASNASLIETAHRKIAYWKSVASDRSSRIVRRESAEILADSFSHILWRVQESDRLRREAEALMEYQE
ncbi:MAG TPA: dynamin family protein [Fibrobacteria bacterium]|nr:dynamin family protein [Fibrobacteria bacterium]